MNLGWLKENDKFAKFSNPFWKSIGHYQRNESRWLSSPVYVYKTKIKFCTTINSLSSNQWFVNIVPSTRSIRPSSVLYYKTLIHLTAKRILYWWLSITDQGVSNLSHFINTSSMDSGGHFFFFLKFLKFQLYKLLNQLGMFVLISVHYYSWWFKIWL